MYMTRSFLPVGQGAFYVERFHNDNGPRDNIVVYDCGSQSKRCVERAIKRAFASKRANDNSKVVIDALFISHLHYDHISGIEALLKRCEVKRIYLPYTTPEEREILWLGCVVLNYVNENSFAANFIRDPVGAIRRVDYGGEIFIVEADRYDNENRAEPNGNYEANRISSGENVIEGWNDFTDGFEWKYIPYALKQESRCDELKQLLQVDSAKEIVEMWMNDKDGATRVKEAYKSLAEGSDLNESTLVLYSGGSGFEIMLPLRCNPERWMKRVHNSKCGYRDKIGCVYMGDYNAQKYWEELRAYVLNRVCAKIGLFQVPHHGSRASFNEALLDYDAEFVISAGCTNRHGHPADEVVGKILSKEKALHIVSDCLSSEFVQVLLPRGLRSFGLVPWKN